MKIVGHLEVAKVSLHWASFVIWKGLIQPFI